MRAFGALTALASVLMGGPFAEAIYGDDHWTYSKKLTLDNFEETVQSEIDAGRTFFAPSWDATTKTFAGNSDVSFGDVNLSEQSIRGAPHNPGAGGWPTIRYFNKQTGPEGANYEKKTSKPMCQELDEEMMTAYVEEAGGTSLCTALSGAGCDERELGFIEKMRAKGTEGQETELRRLESMAGKSMKPELKKWLQKRTKILNQLVIGHSEL